MKSYCQRILLAVIATVLLSALAFAENTPGLLSYQGRLTDTTGTPLNLTNQAMTFRIWNNSTLTDPPFLKWEETQVVQVVNGLFNVVLGTINPLTDSVFSSSESFLGISIGNDPEGTPRTRLVSVGYSTRVETIEGAKGGVISGTVTLSAGGAKSASSAFPEFNILNNANQTAYSANEARVFTPCVLFADDSTLQCSAATNSGAAQSEDGASVTSIGSTVTVLLQQSIDCPSAGYVLVMGSCQANINHHEHTTSSAEFGVSDQASGFCWDQHKNWTIPEDLEGGNYANVISAQKIFSVQAGTNSFWFLAHKVCGGTMSAVDKTLSLVFIPKAYGTVQSLAATGSPDAPLDPQNANALTTVGHQSYSATKTISNDQSDVSLSNRIAAQEREIAALKMQLSTLQSMMMNTNKAQK